MRQKIFDILDSLWVEYKNFEHNPVFTCEEALSVDLPWKKVKSLLLYNKKKTNYYMVVLEDYKKLDVKVLMDRFDERKLNFAREEYMLEKIWVLPGHVSPFALINNIDNDIKVIFDNNIKGSLIGFHPWRNDNTVILNLPDVEKFLQKVGNTFEYLDL